MLVMVDQNELATNPKVVKLLQKYFPKLQVTSLEFGDINIVLESGSLLSIERKNVNDFLGSVGDGRVFRQVEQMANGSTYYAIILVGELKYTEEDMVIANGRETGWKGASVRAAMFAIQWSGCPMIMCNQAGFPLVIQELIQFCEKPSEHVQKLGHKRIVTFPPIDRRIDLLTMFPGIGLKRADALLRYVRDPDKIYGDEPDGIYGTVAEALVWGSAMNLIKFNGRPADWGDATVENFRVSLGLDAQEYIDIKKDDGKK